MTTRTVVVPAAVANGTLPTAYDPNWRTYQIALTPAQIAAFMAFPQDLVRFVLQCHASNLQNVATANSVTPANAATFIQTVTTAAVAAISGITAATPTITTQAQVSAAVLTVAPSAVATPSSV